MPIDVNGFEDAFFDRLSARDRLAHRKSRMAPNHAPKRTRADVIASAVESDDPMESGFNPTYDASRHERVWIEDALGPFVQEGVITDVLRLIKGGKEATVYLCAAASTLGVDALAAKVYRPQRFRNLRNDAQYREGRVMLSSSGKLIRDWRALAAIQQGTDVGKALAHASWVAHEAAALTAFHAAGLDVPRLFASRPNALLMEYLGDGDTPAPALHQLTLERDEAVEGFHRVMFNVEAMLRLGWVHGDLSAFNILFHDGRFVLIDFPQALRPEENRSAEAIFRRDVARVCSYFARAGVASDAEELASRMWRAHVSPELWMPEGEEEVGWA